MEARRRFLDFHRWGEFQSVDVLQLDWLEIKIPGDVVTQSDHSGGMNNPFQRVVVFSQRPRDSGEPFFFPRRPFMLQKWKMQLKSPN